MRIVRVCCVARWDSRACLQIEIEKRVEETLSHADEKSRSVGAADSIDHHRENSRQVEKGTADPDRCSATKVVRHHTRKCTGEDVSQNKERAEELLAERRNVVPHRGCRVAIPKDLCRGIIITPLWTRTTTWKLERTSRNPGIAWRVSKLIVSQPYRKAVDATREQLSRHLQWSTMPYCFATVGPFILRE